MLWNARFLPRKTQEFQIYLSDTLSSVVGVYETWLLSHLSLNLPGYTIFREDRHQRRGGGMLLALRDTLVHSQLHLPQSQDGHLEAVAARVSLKRGRLTVAVCYNPDGAASYQDYKHYFSHLPLPVLIMGDFNVHHQHWDPTLPPNHRNTSDNTLPQVLIDSLHLSLLSPPGLVTRFHLASHPTYNHSKILTKSSKRQLTFQDLQTSHRPIHVRNSRRPHTP